MKRYVYPSSRSITACLIALLVALLAAGVASAKPKEPNGHVVRPGESIQAAVDAAEAGDTIVVQKGVYHETVVIDKEGVSLRGVKAVLKPPTDPTSPCGPSGFCVLGDVDFETGEVAEYVEDVSISGFKIRDFEENGIIAFGARDAKFVKNRAFDNHEYGIAAFASKGTKIVSNVTSGSEDAGIYVGDSPRARATVAANETFDNALGIFVRNALHGKIVGNRSHDNCVGMLFLADAPGPAGEFDVHGNKVEDNTRLCPAGEEAPPLSGAGIALLGARGMEIKGNQVLGNAPSGPSAFSGGVVVTSGFGGTPPTDNTIVGNKILRNEPDIFWDESGSGNRLTPNNCETSKPEGLCKR
jgi:parallel beta helix pectate lyase-like protein